MRHILVKTKALADEIDAQLKNGGDFAELAKKYSKDTGSAAAGRQARRSEGPDRRREFDKVAFALKTNELSKPVKTQYGWHIIQALSRRQAGARRRRSRTSRRRSSAAARPAEEDRRDDEVARRR